jgi:hypothetical protein
MNKLLHTLSQTVRSNFSRTAETRHLLPQLQTFTLSAIPNLSPSHRNRGCHGRAEKAAVSSSASRRAACSSLSCRLDRTQTGHAPLALLLAAFAAGVAAYAANVVQLRASLYN